MYIILCSNNKSGLTIDFWLGFFFVSRGPRRDTKGCSLDPTFFIVCYGRGWGHSGIRWWLWGCRGRVWTCHSFYNRIKIGFIRFYSYRCTFQYGQFYSTAVLTCFCSEVEVKFFALDCSKHAFLSYKNTK